LSTSSTPKLELAAPIPLSPGPAEQVDALDVSEPASLGLD
jgi:hypothetical protein